MPHKNEGFLLARTHPSARFFHDSNRFNRSSRFSREACFFLRILMSRFFVFESGCRRDFGRWIGENSNRAISTLTKKTETSERFCMSQEKITFLSFSCVTIDNEFSSWNKHIKRIR